MDRQRILALFAVAWVSAAGLTWFLYAKTKAPKTEKRIRVVVAGRDMPLGTLVKSTDLKTVALLDSDVPKGAIFQPKDAVNRVLLYPANVNEALVISKLSAATSAEGVSSTIEPGFRAV